MGTGFTRLVSSAAGRWTCCSAGVTALKIVHALGVPRLCCPSTRHRSTQITPDHSIHEIFLVVVTESRSTRLLGAYLITLFLFDRHHVLSAIPISP